MNPVATPERNRYSAGLSRFPPLVAELAELLRERAAGS